MMGKKLIFAGIILLVLAGLTAFKLGNRTEKGITATGTVEVTQVDITPKTSGYLYQLTIQTGDPVKAGQIVARIARRDLETQGFRNQETEEAEADLASARSVYNKAKADYKRYQNLFEQGAISEQQLDTAKSTYDVAASSLQTSQSRLSSIETDMFIACPSSGLVLSKNYEQGEFVNAGSAIATIGDFNDCWVKIYIASNQLGLIKVGQKAVIKIDSFPNRQFHGRIKEISQKAEFTPRQSITQQERANLVFAVKVKINNSDQILKPGMPADVVLK
jgi:HlyD family secretion protein